MKIRITVDVNDFRDAMGGLETRIEFFKDHAEKFPQSERNWPAYVAQLEASRVRLEAAYEASEMVPA